MKRFFFKSVTGLFLCIVFLWGSAFAAHVDQEKAMQVAASYIEFVVETFDRWDGKIPSIDSVTPVEYKDKMVFWFVKTDPTGYLLVSSRDELSPVKVYSDTGSFDPQRIDTPNSPESWIIPEQYFSVSAVSTTGERMLSSADSGVATDIKNAWDMFSARETDFSSIKKTGDTEFVEVGPIVSTMWGQGDPYNRQCPLENGQRTLVGCVATAWSQLLCHWQWPDRGVGTHTNDLEENEEVYTVNFAEQTWNWDLMPDVLTETSPHASIDEVAKLCFQVGVAANMDWGLEGSGSNEYANDVLDVYFKYKSDMTKHFRGDSSADYWFNLFKNEFDATPARPVVMSIFALEGGGHEILADGYQTGATNKVHLNMGWYGNWDAYYDVTSEFAAPESLTWDDASQVIVIGVEPDYSLRESASLAPVYMLLLE
jgi:hypothetical protein